MPNWIADRRRYVTPDGEVVDESAPGRKNLLCAEGAMVREEVCRQYGLGPFEGQQITEPVVEPTADQEQGEDPGGGGEAGEVVEHPGKPHAWRKDGTCRCGAVKPETPEAGGE